MVQQLDAKHRTCPFNPLCQQNVIPARVRNAARVIVQQQNADSLLPDGFDENFARRNQRSINGSPRNDSIPYQLPLAVQHRKNKHLLFFMPQCFHIIFCDRRPGHERK